LARRETVVTESSIGTRFTGQALAETQVGRGSGAFRAVIPRVTGSAYVTGFHQFVLDRDDLFPAGFLLR
jgi:proline racemase/trans-L-3-hydroxyproline dehydratase